MITPVKNPIRFLPLVAALAAGLWPAARIRAAAIYPDYTPQAVLEEGELHSMGSITMDEIALGWMAIFRKAYPEIEDATIEARHNNTVIAGLLSGQSQLGPCSRALFPGEVALFVSKFGYKPTAVRVSGGAFDKVGASPALCLYVHQDNPLTKLTVEQVEEIFSKAGKINTWGDLGLTGEWADKKIKLFGLPQPNGISLFLQQTAMHSRDLRPDIIARGRVGKVHALNAMVMDVAADRYAMTYAAGGNRQPGTKILALARTADSPAVMPTLETVTDRTYPLCRYLYIYINRPPGKPVNPMIREYLRIALSKQGQEIIAEHSDFLPLPPEVVQEELAKLDANGIPKVPPGPNVTVQGGTPEEFRETFQAKAEDSTPVYKPVAGLSGTVISMGTDTMEDLIKMWSEGFKKVQPNITIQSESKGSMTSEPNLQEGRSQLAPASRDLFPYEIERFKKVHGYGPLAIKVALGSYRTPERSGSVAFYVNKNNPINHLSFKQLAAIFSASGGQNITKWGQLGLTGEWADRDIHMVGVEPVDGNANFIQQYVSHGRDFKPNIKGERIGPSTKLFVRVLADIAGDPAAIGYAGFLYANPGAKRLGVAETEAGPFLTGEFDEVASARYALTRFVYIYVNKAPGKPLPPETKEFLRYVLSLEGQRTVEKDIGYMPLPARLVKQELAKLE